jgi:hypothetical protein
MTDAWGSRRRSERSTEHPTADPPSDASTRFSPPSIGRRFRPSGVRRRVRRRHRAAARGAARLLRRATTNGYAEGVINKVK